MFSLFKLCQINAIKERTKALSALEREISNYVDEGRDEYKEVAAWLHPCFFQLVDKCIHPLVFAEQRGGASRNQRSAARGGETQRQGRQRDGNHPPGY